MRSNDLHVFFQNNNEAFIRYHINAIAEEATQPFLNHILAKIQEKIKAEKAPMTILHLGCGMIAKIREHFQENPLCNVRSFDHVSMSSKVETCDITHLPVEDESARIVVLTQAMLGSNPKDYLLEASRVLSGFGRLYIAELSNKWTIEGQQTSFELMKLLLECGFFVTNQLYGKFTVFECVKR
jgi:ubiquinone/menaquinone biosynthesis C-methylase UbiE